MLSIGPALGIGLLAGGARAEIVEDWNREAGVKRSWAVAADDAGHVYWAPRVEGDFLLGDSVGFYKYDAEGQLLCQVGNGPRWTAPTVPADFPAVPATGWRSGLGNDRPFVAQVGPDGFVYVAGATLDSPHLGGEDWFILRFHAEDPDGPGDNIEACDWDATWPDPAHNAVIENWDTDATNDTYDEIDGLAITEDHIYATGYAGAEWFPWGPKASDIGIAKYRVVDGGRVWRMPWDPSGAFDSADGHLHLAADGTDPVIWLVGRYGDCNMLSVCIGGHTKQPLIARIRDDQGSPKGSVRPLDPGPGDFHLRVWKPGSQYYGLATDGEHVYAIGGVLETPSTQFVDKYPAGGTPLAAPLVHRELARVSEAYQGRAGLVDRARGLLWLTTMRGDPAAPAEQDATMISLRTSTLALRSEDKIPADNTPDFEDGLQETRDLVRIGDAHFVAGDTAGASDPAANVPFLRRYSDAERDADSFASGDLSAWLTSVEIDAGLAVNAASALDGDGFGLKVDLGAGGASGAAAVFDTVAPAATAYRANFWIDPSPLTMTPGDDHAIFVAAPAGGAPVALVLLRREAGAWMLQGAAAEQGGTRVTQALALCNDPCSPQRIEIEWWAASSGTSDGAFTLTNLSDAAGPAELTDLDNAAGQIDLIGLGAIAGVDPATAGSYALDAFASFAP